MYAPDDLLEQLKMQVLSEFPDQIISFQWVHEQECSFVYVQIGEIALQIPMIDRIHEMAYTIVGHPDDSPYIVPISVSAMESIEATDGLFNLTYHGAGSNSFFVYYYVPGRDRLRPYQFSVHYQEMFDAMRTIHFDSPEQVWKRLVRPIDEKYAKYGEVHSFSKEVLAEELRDFLLKHLDFIKHIAKVINKPFEIFEPIMDTQSSNGRVKGIFFKANQANEMELALAAA